MPARKQRRPDQTQCHTCQTPTNLSISAPNQQLTAWSGVAMKGREDATGLNIAEVEKRL